MDKTDLYGEKNRIYVVNRRRGRYLQPDDSDCQHANPDLRPDSIVNRSHPLR